MSLCDYCGKKISGYPHKCKYCSWLHCPEHLQPESHDCIGLENYKQGNKDRWKRGIADSFGKNPSSYQDDNMVTETEENNLESPRKRHKKLSFSNRLKNYGLDRYYRASYWLRRREHDSYNYQRRSSYLIITILIFVASVVALTVFYSNAQKLNEINLGRIKLGGVLILGSLFFIIKFGWSLIKEAINIFKRQRNWLRYLTIILIIFLLWQAYVHRNSALNPLFEAYNKTNFSLLVPISLNSLSFDKTSQSSDTYSNNNEEDSEFSKFVNGVFDPKSQIDISDLEQEVHRLINIERTNNGLKPLIWDDKIALIAREHSQNMADRDFFAHDNPEGQDPTDRGEKQGYTCRKDYGSYYTYGLAENIALTPIHSDVVGCGSTTSLDSLAECIVEGWMTSPGHRENILTRTYTKAGIGIAYSEDDEAYSTQDFC